MIMNRSFSPRDMTEFEPAAKIGLLSTIDPGDKPHITLITALQAMDSTHLVWGQFSEGMSKKNVHRDPKTAFLIMTPKRSLWRGKTLWTRSSCKGAEFEMFNAKPMYRYNSYFGIHTVHYMDLVETTKKEKLPLMPVAFSTLKTKAAKSRARTGIDDPTLNPWTVELFNRVDSLSFMSYITDDGFPWIFPVIQCQAADSSRLVLSPAPYILSHHGIKKHTEVAVFCMNADLETVLVRGTFGDTRRYRGMLMSTVDINWVYNSMPPVPGQIYPPVDLLPAAGL